MNLKCRILNIIPKFMRSWFFLRKFYWQKEEIEQAYKDAEDLYNNLIREGRDESS